MRDAQVKTYNNILTFLKRMLTWGVRVGYLAPIRPQTKSGRRLSGTRWTF
jgi:hypothetical protein